MEQTEPTEKTERRLTTFDLICMAKAFERELENREGVVDDDFEQALAEFFADDELTDKIKKCRYVLQRFKAESRTLKDEADRLTAKRRSLDARFKKVESMVAEFVETAVGLPEAKTDKRNPNRLILDESLSVCLVKPKSLQICDLDAALTGLDDTLFIKRSTALDKAEIVKEAKKETPSPSVAALLESGVIRWTEGRSLRWS